jgi:hypothetical protein
MKQNLSKGNMNKGFFLFFLSFQFCDIESLENNSQKNCKISWLTLNKQDIINYFVQNKTKKSKKKIVDDVIYKKKKIK